MYGPQLLTSRGGPPYRASNNETPQLFEHRQPSKFFASKCISFGPSKSKGTSEKPEGEVFFCRFCCTFLSPNDWNPEICLDLESLIMTEITVVTKDFWNGNKPSFQWGWVPAFQGFSIQKKQSETTAYLATLCDLLGMVIYMWPFNLVASN